MINPAGIVFGPNARLDIGDSTCGSFVATTLDAITFPGGGQFSAVNPGNAGSLLTLVGDPSGFLASQRQPRAIASASQELKVYPEQSLLLLGGEIQLNNSLLQANNGRVELVGFAGAGFMGLTTTGNILTLDIPAQIPRLDVAQQVAVGCRPLHLSHCRMKIRQQSGWWWSQKARGFQKIVDSLHLLLDLLLPLLP